MRKTEYSRTASSTASSTCEDHVELVGILPLQVHVLVLLVALHVSPEDGLGTSSLRDLRKGEGM